LVASGADRGENRLAGPLILNFNFRLANSKNRGTLGRGEPASDFRSRAETLERPRRYGRGAMKFGLLRLAMAGVLSSLAIVSAATAADKPVFGLVMSFSGWFQPIDADTVAGAKLAVGDVNAAGGVLGQPIEIVQFDNKSEPALGADGALEVIHKGAKAILFPSDFDFGAPGAYVAQQNNVIAFSAASDPKFGVQGIGPLAYSVSNASQAQGGLMAEWAFKTKGWKTAYVLIDNTISYTKSLCGSFATRFKELAGADGLLGQDTFLNNDPSIAAQITRITSLPKKPDLVFLCSYVPGGPSAIRQLRAAGIEAPILTGESMDGDFWIGSVPNLSNFYIVNYGSKYGDDPNADVNAFFKRFETKYGRKADVSYGLRGYSAVQAWAKAANEAGSLDGDKVAAKLDAFNKTPLVIGPTTWTPSVHIATDRPMTILGVKDGKFSSEGRYTVEKFPPF
jgi:branched-chain amino acid transport system substrate-binding protein